MRRGTGALAEQRVTARHLVHDHAAALGAAEPLNALQHGIRAHRDPPAPAGLPDGSNQREPRSCQLFQTASSAGWRRSRRCSPGPSLGQRVDDPTTSWQRVRVSGWYGGGERQLDITSGTALWYHPGKQVPIRWVLVRDSQGLFEPQGFLCTDLRAEPLAVLRWFVRRWAVEVTFAEVRRHLGVETQRQWLDPAIARTTPALLGLFSLVTLWADEITAQATIIPRATAWYAKAEPTFSDALAAVRYQLWNETTSSPSAQGAEIAKLSGAVLNRLIQAACWPA